jgi:hypothetical protein
MANWAFFQGDPRLSHSAMNTFHLDRVLLAIWPSSIFMMADPEGKSVLIPIVSITVNAVLYGAIGWFVWLGLYRNKAIILGAVVGTVVAGWYLLLSWYLGW